MDLPYPKSRMRETATLPRIFNALWLSTLHWHIYLYFRNFCAPCPFIRHFSHLSYSIFFGVESKKISKCCLFYIALFCVLHKAVYLIWCWFIVLFVSVVQLTDPCPCRLIVEVSRSRIIRHKHARARAVGLLWTSDQLVVGATICTTHNTHSRRSNPRPQQTYDLYLTVSVNGNYIYDNKMFMINKLDYVMAFVQTRSIQALRLYRCHPIFQNFVIRCLNMQFNSRIQRNTNRS